MQRQRCQRVHHRFGDSGIAGHTLLDVTRHMLRIKFQREAQDFPHVFRIADGSNLAVDAQRIKCVHPRHNDLNNARAKHPKRQWHQP